MSIVLVFRCFHDLVRLLLLLLSFVSKWICWLSCECTLCVCVCSVCRSISLSLSGHRCLDNTMCIGHKSGFLALSIRWNRTRRQYAYIENSVSFTANGSWISPFMTRLNFELDFMSLFFFFWHLTTQTHFQIVLTGFEIVTVPWIGSECDIVFPSIRLTKRPIRNHFRIAWLLKMANNKTGNKEATKCHHRTARRNTDFLFFWIVKSVSLRIRQLYGLYGHCL